MQLWRRATRFLPPPACHLRGTCWDRGEPDGAVHINLPAILCVSVTGPSLGRVRVLFEGYCKLIRGHERGRSQMSEPAEQHSPPTLRRSSRQAKRKLVESSIAQHPVVKATRGGQSTSRLHSSSSSVVISTSPSRNRGRGRGRGRGQGRAVATPPKRRGGRGGGGTGQGKEPQREVGGRKSGSSPSPRREPVAPTVPRFDWSSRLSRATGIGKNRSQTVEVSSAPSRPGPSGLQPQLPGLKRGGSTIKGNQSPPTEGLGVGTRAGQRASQRGGGGRSKTTGGGCSRRAGQRGGDKSMAEADGEGAGGGGGAGGAVGGLAPADDSAQGATGSSVGAGTSGESESDDSDMGRLQALLEARGLPPQLFGSLGPRMQQLFHRTLGSGSSSKAQQLVSGLQASGDESQQLQSLIELCQLLVMGNEETLGGFPVKHAVPALISLLQMEHNFDMMHHACRALTYLMEALPRSSAVVVDAVPALVEKLQVIQCMDVAEQALTALEMLARRHSKAILQAGGLAGSLLYLEFFSINAQRHALATASHCCQALGPCDFHLVSDSLPLLCQRLAHHDKKSVESTCLCFSRLVENFQHDQALLQELCGSNLLPALQRLLSLSPPLLSSQMFVNVVRTLARICACSPALAAQLLQNNIADTLSRLLCGEGDRERASGELEGDVKEKEKERGRVGDSLELVSRSPQELFELTSLICELLPSLPTDGIFSVDAWLERGPGSGLGGLGGAGGSGGPGSGPLWEWQDDRGSWLPYSHIDGRIIEAAHQAGEEEVSLSTLGRVYTVDLSAMRQVNEQTGTARPVQRRPGRSPPPPHGQRSAAVPAEDARACLMRDPDSGPAGPFVRRLFGVLYELCVSSAGPAIRHKCLRAILRVLYHAPASLLAEVLRSQPLSSHLASMLSSSDLRVVVGAVQMAIILMEKLPDIFCLFFQREGVTHQMTRLASVGPASPLRDVSSGTVAAGGSEDPVVGSAPPVPPAPPPALSVPLVEPEVEAQRYALPAVLSRVEVLKRKRLPKRAARRVRTHDDDGKPTPPPHSSFLGSLHPSRWAHPPSPHPPSPSPSPSPTTPPGPPPAPMESGRGNTALRITGTRDTGSGSRERVRLWVKEQATSFLSRFPSPPLERGIDTQPHGLLPRLTRAATRLSQGDSAVTTLQEVCSLLVESDASAFELQHSGLLTELLFFLTGTRLPSLSSQHLSCSLQMPSQPLTSIPVVQPRDRRSDGEVQNYKEWLAVGQPQRLRLLAFCHVFLGCPAPDASLKDFVRLPSDPPLLPLVHRLNGCLSQLEQFQVKVHDLPGGNGAGSRGSQALKFFNTHQLKCQLQRHPDCSTVRQWRGGPVKIDPLALVQAIERYLVVRGYGRVREEDDSDEDASEDEVDESLASQVLSSRHRLQFYLGGHLLPYGMTVYQAVRQYGGTGASEDDGTDGTDDETGVLGRAGIWLRTHTIWYRPVPEGDLRSDGADGVQSRTQAGTTVGGGGGKGGRGIGVTNRQSPKGGRRHDELWNAGIPPRPVNPLELVLPPPCPPPSSLIDPSLHLLYLLRSLHAISRYWYHLYPDGESVEAIASSEFVNAKMAAKASRQLQDPLVILTGNLPAWVTQLGKTCPFLLPFDTRQLLFCAIALDRDRAMQRLLDSNPELSPPDGAEARVAPRLDRKKRTVSRDDLLKQAEAVMSELGASRALLEVQYENEVGTGLGPTLEFYALVSQEIQRADLCLWRDEDPSPTGRGPGSRPVSFPQGLFPGPLPRGVKVATLTKVKLKFRFLGRLMAKALLDSRMLDLPLSLPFCRWLLGQESCLGLAGIASLDAQLYRSIRQLFRSKAGAPQDPQVPNSMPPSPSSSTTEPLVPALAGLSVASAPLPLDTKHGSSELSSPQPPDSPDPIDVEDLGLDFTLPGYPNIELRRGGRDIAVTSENVEDYVRLVVHWTLVEGVWRQFEALREGFQSVLPLHHLQLFFPEELDMLLCGGQSEAWDVRQLMDSCRPDHGYNHDSRAVRFLFEVLSSFDSSQQRLFLQFVTGSPRLPVGGFRSLNPPLTIVRKGEGGEKGGDGALPSVMTCVNYLKLPDYSSASVLRERLLLAAREGQRSFHLS
uniref:E3 ubiquitin-protein ligase TRIP12 isoform X2 n=1 Tax=Myxine glutinosa TaxID=7769 RepID=UPI00358FECBF